MSRGTLRTRILSAIAAVGLATGVLAVTAGAGASAAAQAAVTCPTVDPTTHAVTPPPAPGVDWAGCDLLQADMAGADLSGADLLGATLDDADLAGADLAGLDLGSADLDGATLTGADLGGTDLAGANLTKVASGGITGAPALPAGWLAVDGYLIGPTAVLTDASLAGAPLATADLDGANLTGADLDSADLSDANLTAAIAEDVALDQADLAGATLALIFGRGITGTPELPAHWFLLSGYLISPGADVGNADLAGADLSGDDLAGTSFGEADLNGADLGGADLAGGSLFSASVTGASLAGTDLAGANLTNAGMIQASLPGADLFRANLSGTVWSDTTCPDGSNSGTHANGCSSALAYGFAGFTAPRPGSTVRKSARSFSAQFRLTAPGGSAITSAIGSSLGDAREVRVTLAGPRIKAVTAYCRWAAAEHGFACAVDFPSSVRAGKAYRYTITAAENFGPGFVRAPAARGAVNPAVIHFS